MTFGPRLVTALAMVTTLAGCVQAQTGVVGVQRSESGEPSILVAWCGETPSRLTVTILVDKSWEKVAKFTTTKIRGGSATLDLHSPSPDWQLIYGDPRLKDGVSYYAEATPDSGTDAIVGQLNFTLKDVEALRPGDIFAGSRGHPYTWDEFRDAAKDMCR